MYLIDYDEINRWNAVTPSLFILLFVSMTRAALAPSPGFALYWAVGKP